MSELLELAVVTDMHGTERLSDFMLQYYGRVKGKHARIRTIRANPRASDLGVRYIHEDLNRVFPGNHESSSYEQSRAAEIMDRLQGKNVTYNASENSLLAANHDPVDLVLDLHRSYADTDPFCLISELSEAHKTIMRCFNMRRMIDISFNGKLTGTLLHHFSGVMLEFGRLEEYGNTEYVQRCLRKGFHNLLSEEHLDPIFVDRFREYGSLSREHYQSLRSKGEEQIQNFERFSKEQRRLLDLPPNTVPAFINGYPDRWCRVLQHVDTVEC